MSEQSKKQPDKKVYSKPSLRTIELVVDEMLCAGCKAKRTPGLGDKNVAKKTCVADKVS